MSNNNLSWILNQIPAEYVTETELEAKGYLTEHQDISGLVTKEYVDNAITNLNINIDYDSLLAFDTTEIIRELNYVDNYIDNDNNLILDDDLPAGTYTLKYEFEDGTYTDIKNFIIENKPSDKPSGTVVNLLEEGEKYLNQRYSKSSGGFIEANGVLCLMIPFKNDSNNSMLLTFDNLTYSMLGNNCLLYILDNNKSNPLTVNGNCDFVKMTSGVETAEDKLSGTVTFTPPINEGYLAICIRSKDDGTPATMDEFENYIITLTTVEGGGNN